ncbi:MAG: hypothetical protein R2864_02105 [Syntrophotaleaceae bacterium]
MLGSKTGDAGELENLLVAEGIADLDRTVVMNTDDVAGKASSTLVRSWAMKMVALASATSLPMR